jgi:CRISPR-associated protein Cmr1
MDSVVTTANGKGSVRADVYLGFGPVLPPSKKEKRETAMIRGAIGIEDKAVLRLLANETDEIWRTMQLVGWFGAIGSRSRNAWGSISLLPLNGTGQFTPTPLPNHESLKAVAREWLKCLELEWPHAVGMADGPPLIWLSKPLDNWRNAIGCLANVRVEVRRAAKKFVGPNRLGGIHLLGYPAGGKWELPEFKKGRPGKDHDEARLATQLRFKVLASPEGLRAMVFHLPHRFPKKLRERLGQPQQDWLAQYEKKVWEAVHHTLDGMSRVKRIGDNEK